MKEILTYAAQVAIIAACSWLVYKAVFARDSLHRVRRGVLLVLLAASFALPVCRVTVEREVAVGLGIDHLPAVATGLGIDHLVPAAVRTANTAGIESEAVIQNGVEVEDEVEAGADLTAHTELLPAEATTARRSFTPNLFDLLGFVYLAGVLALIAYRLAGVARVRRIMKHAVGEFTTDDGIPVLLLADDIPPFSFGGRIVLSDSDLRSEGVDMILRHETVHIRQRHGFDLAVVNIVAALLWFNPFVWMLRRELVLVHEIAADSGVIRSGFDAKKYQYLLISKITGVAGLLSVANHFRTSDLRKRIVTMKRKSRNANGGINLTKWVATLKILLLLPLAAVALAVFAETRYVAADRVDEPKNVTAVTAEPEKEQLHLPFGNSFRIAGNYVERVVPTRGLTTLMDGVLELNPADRQRLVHTGVDVIPDTDTIRAPYSGRVVSAVFETGYGNKLVIEHRDGLETLYAHLASFLVSEGEAVTGGQPIAIVGNTGLSTAKHLHLETRVYGELKDPLETLFGVKTGASGRAVDGGGILTLNTVPVSGKGTVYFSDFFDVVRKDKAAVSEVVEVVKKDATVWLHTPSEGKKTNSYSYVKNGMVLGRIILYGDIIDPETGWKAFFHSGIDIIPSNDADSVIRAPHRGVVKSAGFETESGNKLVIAHQGGLETAYSHLAGFLVAEGDEVDVDQPIGIIGSTGKSKTKHLHLETRVDGELTDPLETLFGIRFHAPGTASSDEAWIEIPDEMPEIPQGPEHGAK